MSNQKTCTPSLIHPLTKFHTHSSPSNIKSLLLKKLHPLLNIPPKLSQPQVRLLVNCAEDWFRPSTFHNKPLNLFLSMFESLLMLLSGKLTLLIHSRMPNFIFLLFPTYASTTQFFRIQQSPFWVYPHGLLMRNLKPLSISFFHLLISTLSVPLGTGPTHETLLLVTGLSKFQAMFSLCWTSPRMYISLLVYSLSTLASIQLDVWIVKLMVITYLSAKILEYVSTAAKTIRVETALKSLLPFVFPALNQSVLAMTTSQHPPLVPFIHNKCDSRWDVRLGNDGQPLILKSTMYLCLLNSLSLILGLLVVNLLLYSILSFLLNLTLLLWRKLGFLKTQTMSKNMTLCLMAFMSCTHTDPLNSISLDNIKSPSHSSFELLTAKMSFSSHCLFLSVIYRPPNTGNFICELTSYLYFLYSLSSNFILAGISTPQIARLMTTRLVLFYVNSSWSSTWTSPPTDLVTSLTSSLLQNLTVISYIKTGRETLVTPITILFYAISTSLLLPFPLAL